MNPSANGQIYILGPDALSWKAIIQTLAEASGRSSKLMLPAPADVIKLVAGVLDGHAWFPLRE